MTPRIGDEIAKRQKLYKLKNMDFKEFKQPLTTHNITPQMTIETLGTLDATKAAGPDELNNRVLKEARFHLGEVVADLSNTSLRESFVPAQ